VVPAAPSAGSGVFGAFIHAGWFAQAIIIALVLMSIVSWAIIIRKLRQLRRAAQQTRKFRNVFGYRTRLGDYERVAAELSGTPLSSMLLAGVKEWNALREDIGKAQGGPELMQSLIPNISEATERAASTELDRLETSLAFLSITTMVAPFLGLLGTVQGVLVTFLGLRGTQIPTLQTIAPGISDALTTTVMGLLVAIPAALFYNYFVGRVRNLQSDMERFGTELTGIIRREIAGSQIENRGNGQ
jgi:biopolymer transport protein TolQ